MYATEGVLGRDNDNRFNDIGVFDMSVISTYLEEQWDKYGREYMDWCNDHNMQADLSEFQIWLDEQGLGGDDEAYSNE